MIPFIDLKAQRQRLKSQIDEGINRVLDHGRFILGPEVFELEDQLCAYTGAKFCVTVANGTDALQIALMAIGVGPGDEVIVPAFSFIATAEAVALLGASPVFVDIEPRSFNIDVSKIPAAITEKTKAIIPVSLYGVPADFDALNAIGEDYGITIIEDAAQSFGAVYKGRKSCNLSTIACTSFFPTKPLGCYGDGGALFTSDEGLANIMRQIARHGQEKKYLHVRLGVNSRLDTIQAAVLLAKLKILDAEIEERNQIAQIYEEEFASCSAVVPPKVPKHSGSAWAQYTIRVDNREHVQQAISEVGGQTMVHYPITLPAQPALSKDVFVPESDLATRNVLSLPVFGSLDKTDQLSIIESVCRTAE